MYRNKFKTMIILYFVKKKSTQIKEMLKKKRTETKSVELETKITTRWKTQNTWRESFGTHKTTVLCQWRWAQMRGQESCKILRPSYFRGCLWLSGHIDVRDVTSTNPHAGALLSCQLLHSTFAALFPFTVHIFPP